MNTMEVHTHSSMSLQLRITCKEYSIESVNNTTGRRRVWPKRISANRNYGFEERWTDKSDSVKFSFELCDSIAKRWHMSENIIWLNRSQLSSENARVRDRNVALVESAFQFVLVHPFTDADADEVKPGMAYEDALLLRDVIALALRLTVRGPAEFEAAASKDMAYFEHWLKHYEKQVRRFLEAGDEPPKDGDN